MWTSSLRLRRKTIAASACAVALAYPAAGLAAGGTPMPAPDDPPSTLTPSSTKTTRASGLKTGTAATKRTAESAVPVPMPDAPLVAAPVTSARTQVTRSVPTPAPDVVQHAAPRMTSTAPSVTRTTPSPIRSTKTTASAKPTQRAKPRPIPKATAKAKAQTQTHRRAAPAAAKAHGPAPQPASVLRDAVRLGLPVAVLRARPSDAELNGELLVAAALLLAAAAGGSLLLGITARSATRHA